MANEHINQDNDWATAPPSDAVEATLLEAYTKELFIRELRTHQYRHQRKQNKAQRYFNSTPARHALARVLCIGTYVNQPYTKTEIAEQLGVSRQVTHNLVEECLAEGWAEACECCLKHYRASAMLVAEGEAYARFNCDQVKDTGVVAAFTALSCYQKLRQDS